MILAAVTTVLVVSSFTGVPGPGAAKRYPVAHLDLLAQRIRDESRPSPCNEGRDIASVDLLRSRVVVDGAVSFSLAPGEVDMVADNTTQFLSVTCCIG